jgi:hypothetical protein
MSRRAESPNWLKKRPAKVVGSRLIPVSFLAAKHESPSPRSRILGRRFEKLHRRAHHQLG